MKKILFIGAFVVMSLGMSLASCEKTDETSNSGPRNGNIINDPEGTIVANIRNSGSTWQGVSYSYTDVGNMRLAMTNGNNFTTLLDNFSILYVGKVEGLGAIRLSDAKSYTSSVAVIEGGGYTLRDDEGYARLYVESFMTSGSTIIGATFKYQWPFYN